MNSLDVSLPVFAVVGGIGSGKSAVARELSRQGGYLIQADELGHEALQQPAIRDKIAGRWGPGLLDEKGNILRRKLGQIVFADPEARRELEAMVLPFIRRRIEEEIEKAKETVGVRFIVLDAATILEASWTQDLDHLIFVEAPREVRLERVRMRGWDEGELQRREDAQMPLEEKKNRADAVIENPQGLEAIEKQVSDLLKRWKLA